MTIYVFDTSYLVEFSDCDAMPDVRDRIRGMFQDAVDYEVVEAGNGNRTRISLGVLKPFHR
jgi:hypothetical protein